MATYCGLAVVLILSLLCVGIDGYTCNDFKSCDTCVARNTWLGTSCRWCPLSFECHTFGSIYNPCSSSSNIKVTESCFELSYREFSPEIAFRNMHVSAATYCDAPQACLDKIYPQGNIEVFELIRGKCEDLGVFEYSECFSYTAVSHSDKTILLTFRGVYSDDQLIDLIGSIALSPMVPFPTGGKVQNYFKNAFDSTYPCSSLSVEELFNLYPDYEVMVTGDSFGAALATLAASSLVYSNIIPRDKLTLYTTGSPRAGDKEYSMRHDELVKTSWRVVHYIDIVSMLPPCGVLGCTLSKNTPYHTGKEIFYRQKEMFLDSEYRQCKQKEDITCSLGLITTDGLTQRIFYHQHYYENLNIGRLCNELRRPNVTDFDGCRRFDAKTMERKN